MAEQQKQDVPVSADVFGGPVVVNINGTPFEFPRLKMGNGYGAVEDAVRGHFESHITALLERMKVEGLARVPFVRDFVPVLVTPEHIEAYLSTRQGVDTVLSKSLISRPGTTKADADAIIAKLDLVTGRDIAMRVLCFRDDPKPADGPGDAGGQAGA